MRYATSNLRDTIMGGTSKKMKGGGLPIDLFELLNNKKEFLVKVFATLISQLGITYYIMMNYNPTTDEEKQMSYGFKIFFLFLIQIGIITIMAFVPMAIYLKLLLFSVFSVTFGIMLSFVGQRVDPNLIKMALVSTGAIFGTMFLMGLSLLALGIKLGSRFGFMLLIALLILIVVRVVSLFTTNYSSNIKGFSLVTIILFAIYIIYDTNKIIQKDYYGDFVTAGMDYYLDIINIFINLINFNSR
jgi:protein lifeguard